MWKKAAGFAIGILAVIGLAYLVTYMINQRQQKAAAQVASASAPAAPAAPSSAATAAGLVSGSCDGMSQIPSAPIPPTFNMFPGSYVTGIYNTGCDGDVRNRKC